MTIGEKIYKLRKERGLTLEYVGTYVGVGKSTVRKWETGDIKNMRHNKIVLLAEVLQTTPAYLMGWTNKMDGAWDEELTTEEKLEVQQKPATTEDDGLSGAEALRIYAEGKKGGPLTQEELNRLDDFAETFIKGLNK